MNPGVGCDLDRALECIAGQLESLCVDVANPFREQDLRRALRVVSPERLMVNPDCGLRHLPPEVARAKLRALTAGTEAARKDLLGTS